MIFVDVTNDIAFRKIFGSESKKKSLISFLNAVINLPENRLILNVEITNPYQLGILSGGKSTIVDVKAKDNLNNVFIVEMQVAEVEYFHKRILYYTSQSYVSQINSGENYQKLKPVYFIGILEFEIGNNPNYFSRHTVLDVETKEQVIQDVEFNFIELPKFTKTLEQLETSIDQWTYFIKNAQDLSVIPENVLDEGLKEAYNEANKQSWKPLELEDYLRRQLKEGDELNRIEFAVKKAVKKAEIKAEIKGEINGKNEEKKNGILKALKRGKLSLEEIAEDFEVSLKEVLKIKAENNL